MLSVLIRSTSALAVIAAIAAPPAFAADPAGKKRCSDLVAFYDRWGATRTPDNSDGAVNHRRIAASLDCERGDYAAGIAKMEALLHDRRFEVPVDIGRAPMYFPDETRTPAQALKSR